MDINWYGHACFRIREGGVTVVTDPHPDDLGYERPRTRADVVTVSHAHAGHSDVKGFRGAPHVFRSPGEYEVGGVFITGVPTFHDAHEGAEEGRNVAFLFDFDGLTVCHLGDLGHLLVQEQVEALGQVNVLLIPVGGGHTLTGPQAADVVNLIEPSIVIPMHYKTPATVRDLAPVSSFLRAMGVSKIAPQEDLRVRASALPEETQVVLLDYGR
ncbi:MAG: MBL fold metallo-hydrolase [Anaerolineae bacterium]|nr:MBL fold metallo-hydrolase [Anaerolineae bacterium]